MRFVLPRTSLRVARTKTRLAVLAGAVFAVALFGACTPEEPAKSPTSELDALKARAQNDLKCAPENIHSKTVDDRTHIAWGCGRTATYVESCDKCGQDGTTSNVALGIRVVQTEAQRCTCTWMLNSAITAE